VPLLKIRVGVDLHGIWLALHPIYDAEGRQAARSADEMIRGPICTSRCRPRLTQAEVPGCIEPLLSPRL